MSSPTRPGDPIAVMPDLFGHPRQPPCLTCPGIPPFPSSPARPGIPSCLWQGARRAPWGGAPRSAQPPEAAYSGGGAKISLSPRGIICQCQSPLTFKFFSTISGQNVPNRHLKFAVGNKKPRFCTQPDPQVRTWEQKAPVLYSTETSSSYLGTKRLVFVLNWHLKFAVRNKKPRFCTQPQHKRYAPSLTFLIVRSFRQVAAHQPASYAPAGQVSVQQ